MAKITDRQTNGHENSWGRYLEKNYHKIDMIFQSNQRIVKLINLINTSLALLYMTSISINLNNRTNINFEINTKRSKIIIVFNFEFWSQILFNTILSFGPKYCLIQF